MMCYRLSHEIRSGTTLETPLHDQYYIGTDHHQLRSNKVDIQLALAITQVTQGL